MICGRKLLIPFSNPRQRSQNTRRNYTRHDWGVRDIPVSSALWLSLMERCVRDGLGSVFARLRQVAEGNPAFVAVRPARRCLFSFAVLWYNQARPKERRKASRE